MICIIRWLKYYHKQLAINWLQPKQQRFELGKHSICCSVQVQSKLKENYNSWDLILIQKFFSDLFINKSLRLRSENCNYRNSGAVKVKTENHSRFVGIAVEWEIFLSFELFLHRSYPEQVFGNVVKQLLQLIRYINLLQCINKHRWQIAVVYHFGSVK